MYDVLMDWTESVKSSGESVCKLFK